jgi:hypothetical protein
LSVGGYQWTAALITLKEQYLAKYLFRIGFQSNSRATEQLQSHRVLKIEAKIGRILEKFNVSALILAPSSPRKPLRSATHVS